MEKIFKGLVIGLLVILVIFSILIYAKSSNKFGSTTAGDISIGGNLSVTGTSTLTGATTQTGALTVTGDAYIHGLVETGGVLTGIYGSQSYTASQFCDNTYIKANAGAEDEGETISSSSFPTSAAIIADCLATTGSAKRIYLDNTATISGRYIELSTTAADVLDEYDIYFGALPDSFEALASTSYYRLDAGERWLITAINENGTSVSYTFDKKASAGWAGLTD